MVGAQIVYGAEEVEASLERSSGLTVGLLEHRADVVHAEARGWCGRAALVFGFGVRYLLGSRFGLFVGARAVVLGGFLGRPRWREILLLLSRPLGGLLGSSCLGAVEQRGVPDAPVEVRVELQLGQLAHVTRQRHHPRVVVVVV